MGTFLDLTGQRFGSRIVLERVPHSGQAQWLVRCDCGYQSVVPSQRLRAGLGNSCPHCSKTKLHAEDLSGCTFGNWAVLHRSDIAADRPMWDVRCQCGRFGRVSGGDLRRGHSLGCKSCGHVTQSPCVNLDVPAWCWLLGLFQGDGHARIRPLKGGGVVFSAKPPANQKKILDVLSDLGVRGVQQESGVSVYSLRLAQEFLQYKTCGVDREQWLFPKMPTHLLQWLAGVVDSDGWVKKNGKAIVIYQKPHPGYEKIGEVLNHLGVPYAQTLQPEGRLVTFRINLPGLQVLRGWLPLQYPAKLQRYLQTSEQ